MFSFVSSVCTHIAFAMLLAVRYKGRLSMPILSKLRTTSYHFTLYMSRHSRIKTFPGLVRLNWGIFNIAYVPLRLSVLPRLSTGAIHDAFMLTWYMSKLISEVYRSSRLNTISFILCHIWLCTSPVISLYSAFRTLQCVSLKKH